MKKMLLLIAIGLVGIVGAGVVTGQPAHPDFKAISDEELTAAGLSLETVAQVDGAVSRDSVVGAAEERFGGGTAQGVALAQMSRLGMDTSQPVWVVEMNVSKLTGSEAPTSRLIFFDAKTGEFLFAQDTLK